MTLKTICRACPHFIRNITKCEFYLRRCSTEKLWRGELPPPKQCPNKQKLTELGCLDYE